MKPSNNETFQLVCMKVQTNISEEPPLAYNQDKMRIKVYYDLFNYIGSYRNTIQFQISSRR